MFTILNRKYSFSEAQFRHAVSVNHSIAGTLRDLNLVIGGANYIKTTRLIKLLNIDNSHWTGKGHLKNKTHNWAPKRPLSEILIKNSDYTSTNHLRERLIKENILPNNCLICSLSDWLNKPITLHLDHINGNQTDNRIENLRLLCPNCHSQTRTYCRKKSKLNGTSRGT